MKILSSPQFFGPGRRGKNTYLDQHVVLDDEELTAFSRVLPDFRDRLLDSMKDLKIKPLQPSIEVDSNRAMQAFAAFYGFIALSLQQKAGHRVTERNTSPDDVSGGVWAWFEFEHDALAIPAAILSYRLISEVLEGLSDGVGLELPEKLLNASSLSKPGLEEAVGQFLEMARPLVLPRDTETMVRVAHHLDIPCQKLERLPYQSDWDESRVRRNGLICLGHGAYQQTVDGTLSIDRNAHLIPIIDDRESLREMLEDAGFPVPERDPAAGNCMLTKHAIRAATSLGFPVVIKTGTRGQRAGVSVGVVSEEQVRTALDRARRIGTSAIVEARVPGKSHKILVVADEVLCVVADDVEHSPEILHQQTRELASRFASQLNVGLMVLDVVVTDIRQPLAENSGAVVDVELAPDLHRLQPKGSDLAERACEMFLRWLYPQDQQSRIPIVAVTGTNGKTTTSRMIAQIARSAGFHTGLVCTDGVYADDKRIGTLEEIGGAAYHHILGRRDVDFAVPEEWFGRIVRAGFAYQWSNVGVCLNVSNDHIGRMGVHTLDQMAEVKEVVVAQAREGVVLNVDDPRCLAMASRAKAKRIGLVSSGPHSELPDLDGLSRPCICTVESRDGKDWIVIHDNGDESSVVAVQDIPATFNGSATHNVSNAVHAATAAYLAGMSVESIGEGLRSFAMSFESTPGRLNLFDGLPYKVILDYAHNDEGFREIAAFARQQECQGRRIVMMAVAGDRRDQEIQGGGTVMAGLFDHYICRNYSGMRGRPLNEAPVLIKQGLMDAGVDVDAITTIEDNEEAIEYSLDLAQEGDLLVLLGGNDEFDLIWRKLNERANKV